MHRPPRPPWRRLLPALVAAAPALSCSSKSPDGGPRVIDVDRAELEVVDVGTFRVDPVGPKSVDIEFDVGADVLSTVVVAAPEGDGVTVFATEFLDPSDARLLSLDTSDVDAILPSLYASKVRAYPFLGPGPFSLLYPGSPAHALGDGTYQVRYNVFGGEARDVRFFTVQKKRAAGAPAPAAGRLPVTLWFAENGRVDADAAGGDDPNAVAFREALAELERIYARAGIAVGPYSFRDLPPDAARRFSVVDGDEFSELFASVDTSETPGLNFFLVESLELDSSGGVVVGLANGIPGPPTLPNLPGGGVVVSLVALEFDPKLVGQVMAHEGGHYLGLTHTTERGGAVFDLLADTPECDLASFDLDGDEAVEAEECAAGGGATNLMFWAADQTPEDVTNDQKFVLLRNPMVDTAGAE